jgi:SEC-C motif-containing protein
MVLDVSGRQGQEPCPCGSGAVLAACCGPYLAGHAWPETAEALMRSRYTAYALGDAHWLRETWHPATRRMDMGIDPEVRWLGLEVLATEDGGQEDTQGLVEFVARYKLGGRAHRLRERSRFRRRDGRWLYVAGDLPDAGP